LILFPALARRWGFLVSLRVKEFFMQGTVKLFNVAKGFGFIKIENADDLFFHKSNVKSAGFRDSLMQGDLVTFEVQNSQKGKRAINIERI
jgi:cold shock protein